MFPLFHLVFTMAYSSATYFISFINVKSSFNKAKTMTRLYFLLVTANH